MDVRQATGADLEAMMAMYDHSRSLMRASGNNTQWVGYPTAELVAGDIGKGHAFIVEQGGRAVGCFALVPGKEPTYAIIEHGHWIDSDGEYATLHRLAKTEGAGAVAEAAFAYAKSKYAYLRFDTHRDNATMRHVARREQFVYSGVVHMNDRTERLAYEWWSHQSVSRSLADYIAANILPLYNSFDSAHDSRHALRVIARTMIIGASRGIEPDLLYAAAAWHDAGLGAGRERHHLEGGRMVRCDNFLLNHFEPGKIELVAQAVEDHRASGGCPPRSMLGRVLAEADRDLEPELIVRRTVEYGLLHYPALGYEQHWTRTLQHLDEKYSAKGYLRLWLDDSPNTTMLAELRNLIADRNLLRRLFDSIMGGL